MKVLPPTLSVRLGLFLYKDAIQLHGFLQGRENDFYSKYLIQLASVQFHENEIMVQKKRKQKKVYFIVNGMVQNQTNGFYFKAGHMLNYDCIYKGEKAKDMYRAKSEIVNALFFTEKTYLQILAQFPDIEEHIQTLIERQGQIQENHDFIKQNWKNDELKS